MDERAALFDIRGRLLIGSISYDQAKSEAAPIIEAMNAKAKAIAKKHNKRFKGFSFSSIMR